MRALFDLTAPLPHGTTVLEASAGTGKTYAIAALATRFIAEASHGVEDLLVITFSRAATAELRFRVRDRIGRTARALRAATRGELPEDADAVMELLADVAPHELEQRARRLEEAFASFDRAAIMTTHEFCHSMLAGLGVLAPQTPQSTLIEDLRPLAAEAAEDVYLQMFADSEDAFPFPRQYDADPGAITVAEKAVTEIAELAAQYSPGPAGLRVEFAARVRAEVEKRKKKRQLYSFDDQLTRLANALTDPELGELARKRLAERFPVVLVDEFQDTDPVQWKALSLAFDGPSTLVLIGDPKQAIYGFRGGDVHTYTRAVGQARRATTLGVNHRSDPEVVEGVQALFSGVLLGEGISAPRVTPAQHPHMVGRPGTPWEAGVQLRAIASNGVLPWMGATKTITDDLVAVVGSLLGEDAPLHHLTEDGVRGRQLRPSEIAVLVRTNERGQRVAAALADAGIPATFNGADSVFGSEAADDWIALLEAFDQPRRPYLQRAFLTDFVGATFADLAQADEQQLSAWSLLVHTWARVLDRVGVPGLVAAMDADASFQARLLSRPDGERLVTDHRHLAELAHHRLTRTPNQRARDLLAWLRTQRDQQAEGVDGARRRDTDADAVEVLTIHRSKGLQWPVVLLPEMAHVFPRGDDDGRPLVLPTDEGRLLDIAGRRSPGRESRWERWVQEDGDESLRSLYVGLTRAQSRVVAWWAAHDRVDESPLHRLLSAGHDEHDAQRPAPAYPLRTPVDRLPGAHWLPDAPIAVVRAGEEPAPQPVSTDSPTEALRARTFTRSIDHTWRRTSYSGLTASAHDLAPAVDTVMVVDEEDAEVALPVDPAWAAPSPMAGLPSGAAFGTLVHSVYESTDASGDDWRDALAEASAGALRRWPLGDVDATSLAEALEPSYCTPLGPLVPGATLRSFAPRDHLAEMDFEFALANPAASLRDIADLMAEHLPGDDPLAEYPSRLAMPGLADQALHGFLTGSIDGVFRLDGNADAAGYLVVDYKTNRLCAPDEELTIGHYTPDAMAEAMMASHYPLQALLYCVALHRFLGARLAGYDPERHLAGVCYLFVRGMAGPDTPLVDGHPLGVFSWRPPAALVLSVSRLLAGGAA